MNHRHWVCSWMLAGTLLLPGLAAEAEFKAGGVTLILPGPTDDFVEAGDRFRTTVFDLLTPSTNRLISAYAPEPVLRQLQEGKLTGGLPQYAMIQVLRRAEYMDCTPEAFAEVLKGLQPALANLDSKIVGNVGEEMNLRLKMLEAKPVEIGRPEVLGEVFRKTDAVGMAMLTAVKQEDQTVRMVSGMAFVRARQRLLFVYLYRRYESAETVAWIRKTLESWTSAIHARNRE